MKVQDGLIGLWDRSVMSEEGSDVHGDYHRHADYSGHLRRDFRMEGNQPNRTSFTRLRAVSTASPTIIPLCMIPS